MPFFNSAFPARVILPSPRLAVMSRMSTASGVSKMWPEIFSKGSSNASRSRAMFENSTLPLRSGEAALPLACNEIRRSPSAEFIPSVRGTSIDTGRLPKTSAARSPLISPAADRVSWPLSIIRTGTGSILNRPSLSRAAAFSMTINICPCLASASREI